MSHARRPSSPGGGCPRNCQFFKCGGGRERVLEEQTPLRLNLPRQLPLRTILGRSSTDLSRKRLGQLQAEFRGWDGWGWLRVFHSRLRVGK